MEETARRTYTAWCVSGELMGNAEVFRRGAWWTVETQPFYTADPWGKKGFRNQSDAYRYASECVSEYLEQAREEERRIHEETGCCVPSEDDLAEWSESFWIKVYDADEGRELESWEL